MAKTYTIKINAGKWKGLQYEFPIHLLDGQTGLSQEKIKQAIFDSLVDLIGINSYFVDFFCGSGQMSVEALSRGFWPVLSIELDGKKVRFLYELKRKLQNKLNNKRKINHKNHFNQEYMVTDDWDESHWIIKKNNSLSLLGQSTKNQVPENDKMSRIAQMAGIKSLHEKPAIFFLDPPFIRLNKKTDKREQEHDAKYWQKLMDILDSFWDQESFRMGRLFFVLHSPKDSSVESIVNGSRIGQSIVRYKVYGNQSMYILGNTNCANKH